MVKNMGVLGSGEEFKRLGSAMGRRATVHGWRKKIMKNWKAQNSEGARWLRGTELELCNGLHSTLKEMPSLPQIPVKLRDGSVARSYFTALSSVPRC
ncbi:hypothetical protein HAX54_009183 [Datura stramonium]|uniref:Uncharacterized protein n=1 Tax=Datura stramonium TaxID=4076 RepID=A0ABS8TEH3_DATST|nr:hypothetical protein [Datura stramonium]